MDHIFVVFLKCVCICSLTLKISEICGVYVCPDFSLDVTNQNKSKDNFDSLLHHVNSFLVYVCDILFAFYLLYHIGLHKDISRDYVMYSEYFPIL